MYLFALVSLFYLIFSNNLRKRVETTNDLEQESQTRGPRVVCGPRGRFVRPAMLFGNFQIFNIYVAECLEKRCREINEPKLNDTQCGFHPGRSRLYYRPKFSLIECIDKET